jgi:hypothetical protein
MLTVIQLIGFLLLIKFKLNDKKLIGVKGSYGPHGPRGDIGNIGIQPNPFPCPTTSPGNIEGDCHILDWQMPELKGDQGLQGKTGLDGIANWDSQEAGFHNLACSGSFENCSNDTLIREQIKNMEQSNARNFWDVYIQQ